MAQQEGSRSPNRSSPSGSLHSASPDIQAVVDANAVATIEPQSPRPASKATSEPQSPRPLSETTRVASVALTNVASNLQPTSTNPGQDDPASPSPGTLPKKTSTPSSTTSKMNRKGKVHNRPHHFADQWMWELLSCCVALLCLVAIVTVLAVHRGRPLPQWPRMISINSLIAIFTALMKAALIFPVAEGISQAKWIWFRRQPRNLIDFQQFDSASRGPLGSLLLLVRARRHYLGSMGALITIVALAIDPFTQQVLRYYNCFQVDAHLVATLPQTNNYTNQGIMTRPLNAELDAPMAGAIYMALLSSPANENAILPFKCRTGNCTFPSDNGNTLSTLGMCSHVQDISDSIRRNETNPGFWTPDWDGESLNSVGLFDPNATTPYQMLYTRKTIAKNPDFDDLVTFDILTLNIDDSCDKAHTENCTKHPFAARHSLYPCIKTYNSSITLGKIEEKVMSFIPLKKTNASAITLTASENLTWSLATNKSLRHGKWITCTPSTNPTPENPVAVSLNGTLPIFHDPNEPKQYFPNDCVWRLDYLSALALHQFASWMFDYSPLLARTENTIGTQGPGWLKTYYREGTVDIAWAKQYMDNLAHTMTARMRQRGETKEAGYAQGQVMTQQACISVAWEWLSLPIAMLAGTIAFLVATIASCVKQDMKIDAWGSSALAAFFSGLDEDAREKAGEVSLRSEIDDKAKDMLLQISRVGGGVRFVCRASA